MLYPLLLALSLTVAPTFAQEPTPETPKPPQVTDTCLLNKDSKPLEKAPKFDGYTLQVWRIRYNEDRTFNRVSDKPLHVRSFSKGEVAQSKSEDVLIWEDEHNPGNLALFRFDRDQQKPKLIRFGNWEVLQVQSDKLAEPSMGVFQAEPTESERQQEYPSVRLVVPADPSFSIESFEFVITPRPCECKELISSDSTLIMLLRKEDQRDRLLRRIFNGLEIHRVINRLQETSKSDQSKTLHDWLEELNRLRWDREIMRFKKSWSRKSSSSSIEEVDQFKDARDLEKNLEIWIKNFFDDSLQRRSIKNLEFSEKLRREAAEKDLKDALRRRFSPDEASDLEQTLDRVLRKLRAK